jgi:hypothetical protein
MNCNQTALKDVKERANKGIFPESIVYNNNGKLELDSWIKPGSIVRIWATMRKNTHPVHHFLSAKLFDSTRMDHVVAEIVAHDLEGNRRDFDFGYMFASGERVCPSAHCLHVYTGRIISPDWFFIDKAKAQAKHPEHEHLRLIALGTLSIDTWNRLKNIVESAESLVIREGDKEGRHVYDLRHPAFGRYRAAVPWVAGFALGGCHNCTSFIMDLFKGMLICITRAMLVVPGSCRSLAAGRQPHCDENGLFTAKAKEETSSDSTAEESDAKRRRIDHLVLSA